MNIFYYLLEANIYLLAFYGLYKLALQNETFYSFNRFYLLAVSAMAFLMPAVTISGLRHTDPVQYVYAAATAQVPAWTRADTFLCVYAAIALCFFVRLSFRLYRIGQLVVREGSTVSNGIKLVAVSNKSHSFSFLNYLFIHPEVEDAETIIRHERVHIKQLHSADILFFEILQAINWFNPFIRYIENDIKALHEFIADKEACGNGQNAGDYALLLIRNSYGARPRELGNSMFNNSLLKQRIMKLNQERSPAIARLKYLLALLLLPLMLCTTAMGFTKSYGIIDLMPANSMLFQDTVKKRVQPGKKATGKKTGKIEEVPVVTEVYVGPKKAIKKSNGIPPPPPPMPPSPKVYKNGKLLPPPPAPPKVIERAIAPPPPPMPPKPKVYKKGDLLPPPTPAPPKVIERAIAPPPPSMPPKPKVYKKGDLLPPPPPAPPKVIERAIAPTPPKITPPKPVVAPAPSASPELIEKVVAPTPANGAKSRLKEKNDEISLQISPEFTKDADGLEMHDILIVSKDKKILHPTANK